MRHVVYDLLIWFLRAVAAVFFRTVEVVGRENIPPVGPVIFAGNHPNSLIDPMLILVTARRRVSFAAKDVLFENVIFRQILRVLGAVPIRRRMDHGGGPVDNSAAFAALHETLRAGGSFGIFPEGISYFKTELQPLKSGCARMALSAAAEGIDVRLVPTGLLYRRQTRLRSRVLIQYGDPIEIPPSLVEKFRTDERAAIDVLTGWLELSLRSLTVNAPDFETLRVLDGVRRLYATGVKLTLQERAELSRRFLCHYERLASVPEVRELYDAVEDYQTTLRLLGLSDGDLSHAPSRAAVAGRIARHVFFLVVLVPFAIPGLLLYLPILALAVFAGEALVARKDVVATAKLGTSVAFVLGLYALAFAGLLFAVPWAELWWAGPTLAALFLLAGWGAVRTLERTAVARRSLWVLARLVTLRAHLADLAATRRALVEQTRALVDRFADRDLPRVLPFASDAPADATLADATPGDATLDDATPADASREAPSADVPRTEGGPQGAKPR